MKIKIFAIVLLILMISNIYIASASVIQKNTLDDSSDDDTINIRVAIFTDEEENEEFYSQFRRTRYFVYALRDYNWTVDDTTYSFDVDLLSTKNLKKGLLTKENYDVMIYPPDTIDTKLTSTYISRYNPSNIIERKRIRDFIEDGGGYFGTCAGAMVAGDMTNRPETVWEKFYQNAMLGISDVKCDLEYQMPLISDLIPGRKPITPNAAYLWYSGANQSNYSVNFHPGTVLDVQIDKNNPIFEDFIGDTRRIRWIGGNDLIVPEDSDNDIKVLARFPEVEMSDKESTQIHRWRYTGGIRGVIKAVMPQGDTHYFENFGFIWNMFIYSGDWEMTDELVETNYASKPIMTSEIYANENKARIVRCTGHPEHNVWWGGYMQDVEDTDHNNVYEAFYKWRDIIPETDTVEDEFSYNYCILRRSVAWTSQKVPDSDLPVVYGESEVCDFDSESKPLDFNVTCNVKTEENPIELDLYFRHSLDQVNWSEYSLFGTDNDSSDGFGFEFNSPNGTGYYEFYSIRRVLLLDGAVERIPPGADSAVFVE